MFHFLKNFLVSQNDNRPSQIQLTFRPEKVVIGEFSNMAQELRDTYLRAHLDVAPKYKHDDVRVRCFEKILWAIYVLQVNTSFIFGVYNDSENAHKLLSPFQYPRDFLENNNKHIIKVISMQTFFLFVHYSFSCIESSLRILVTHLGVPDDYQQIKNGRGTLENIIKYIFQDLGLNANFKDALLVLRLIRDTVHNRGTFHPSNGENRNVTYNGRTYNFVIGQQVSFANAEMVFPLLSDIVELYRQIINHPKIQNIDYIQDPYI